MRIKKAIILAGGFGSRLNPITYGISKHLIPIYNKPMIFYPLSIIMESGIRKFLIIVNKEHLKSYQSLLGDGKKYGINIKYKIQNKPRGLPDAFLIGRKFIGKDPICLNLGDHIFFGSDVSKSLNLNINNFEKSTIFAYKSNNPQHYGVIAFDKNNFPINIEEKPKKPKSNYIVTGLYLFNNDVIKYSSRLKFSKRNELEISDLNKIYLQKKILKVEYINKKNNFWLDAGNSINILKASNLIKKIEQKRNYIGCLEIIALEKGFININKFKKIIDSYKENDYGKILKSYLKTSIKK